MNDSGQNMNRDSGRWWGRGNLPRDPFSVGESSLEAAESWAAEQSIDAVDEFNRRANSKGSLGIFQTTDRPTRRDPRHTAMRATPLRGSSVGELIREARLRAFLTQQELADLAGSSQAEISRWETGKRVPSFSVILRLVGATGHDLDIALIPAAPARSERLPEILLQPAARLLPFEQYMARRTRRIKERLARQKWSRVGPHVPR